MSKATKILILMARASASAASLVVELPHVSTSVAARARNSGRAPRRNRRKRVAEGENVTQGYWNVPEETATVFRDGRLYTGGLATVEEDGFIFVVGRARDFVKCGGKTHKLSNWSSNSWSVRIFWRLP